jgi:hypothetical protein
MDGTEKQKLIRGIEAYRHRQNVILRILRRHKSLTQHDFDRIFSNVKYRKLRDGFMPMMRFMQCEFIESESFILGSLQDGEHGKWLHLIQLMSMVDLVKIQSVGGQIVYSLP